MAGRSSHEMDITHGSVFPKYIAFLIPMALSYMLQYAFNAADIVVIGRFEGADALAAVGSTASLVSLIINFVTGMANGVNVKVATDYSAEKFDAVSDVVHTSIATAMLCGAVFGAIGIVTARPVLRLMQSPDNVIDMSEAYLFVYYLGMPGIALYNFSAAILRAIGDTKRPMNYLIFAGVLNVILNLIFVIGLGLGVVGVAIATTVSNYTSAFLTAGTLLKEDSCLKLYLNRIRLKIKIFKEIMRIGLPVGIQASLFSVANIGIQSTINGFGSVYMAGNSAAQSIESFQLGLDFANMNTMLTFTSQNVGAHKYKRARSTVVKIVLWGMAGLFIVAATMALFRNPLTALFTTETMVAAVAKRRFIFMGFSECLGCVMDAMGNAIRGFGYSVEPMVVTLFGACIFRIIWLNTVFHLCPVYEMVIVVWPVSFVITATIEILVYRKKIRRFPDEDITD